MKFKEASAQNIREMVVYLFWLNLCSNKEDIDDKEWAKTVCNNNIPHMLDKLAKYYFVNNGEVSGSESSWHLVRESLNYLDKNGVYYCNE